MRLTRFPELTAIFKNGKRGEIIAAGKECLDEIERLQYLYCLNLDACFGSWKGKAIAISKLKRLAEAPQK